MSKHYWFSTSTELPFKGSAWPPCECFTLRPLVQADAIWASQPSEGWLVRVPAGCIIYVLIDSSEAVAHLLSPHLSQIPPLIWLLPPISRPTQEFPREYSKGDTDIRCKRWSFGQISLRNVKLMMIHKSPCYRTSQSLWNFNVAGNIFPNLGKDFGHPTVSGGTFSANSIQRNSDPSKFFSHTKYNYFC